MKPKRRTLPEKGKSKKENTVSIGYRLWSVDSNFDHAPEKPIL